MNKLRLLLGCAVFGMALSACSEDGTTETQFEIGGPCQKCPEARLDSIMNLHKETGVIDFSYDVNSGILKVTYDSLKILRKGLADILNNAGYDADLDAGLDSPGDKCCENHSLLSLDPDNDENMELEQDLDEGISDAVEEMDDLENDMGDLQGQAGDFVEEVDLPEEDMELIEEFADEDKAYKRINK